MPYSMFLRSIFILSLVTLLSSISYKDSYTYDVNETCISAQEMKLYQLINSYRKQKKLPPIPLSKSLTFVAQTHSKDLMENKPDTGNCNGHSWSNKGKWTSCCYTPDHLQKECMWNKPKELTTYTDTGYEIAYFSSVGVNPEQALAVWKKSPGHNIVMINGPGWKDFKWKSMGVGIYKNYATVWFGVEPDKEGVPKNCKP
jgi:uncharacterized protein YkwD